MVLIRAVKSLITSPVGAAMKYCDEYVCLCVCVCVCVCLSLCLSTRMSPESHARSVPNFLCMLPMSVAWLVLLRHLAIGHIAYRRKEGDGSELCGQSVIYDCLVFICYNALITF